MRHRAVRGLLVMFVLTFAGTAVAQQPQEKKVGSFTLTKTADKMTDEDRSRAITCGENQKGALMALSLFSIAQRRAAPGGVLSACANSGQSPG